MIQRIQTVYLALVELSYISLFFIPVFGRNLNKTKIVADMKLLDLPELMIAAFIVSALAVATIIQFKKRPLQIKLCNAGMFLSLLVFAGVAGFPSYVSGEFASPLIPFHTVYGIGTWVLALPVVLFFLAGRAIKKDEELVRSADRIR